MKTELSRELSFLHQVAGTVFSNPFHPDFQRGYRELTEYQGKEASVPAHILAEKVEQSLHRAGGPEGLDWKNLEKQEDRRAIRTSILFYLYYRHFKDLGQLFDRQNEQTDTVADHPAPQKLLEDLRRCGFGGDESGAYVGMAWQFCRAHRLIHHSLIGTSQPMQELRMHLWRSIFTDSLPLYEGHMWNRMEEFSTLLLGDTGSGKGVAARIIGESSYIPFHSRQGRFSRSHHQMFTELNLSQFPPSLIESELFGHRKGAFTGAVADYDGHLIRSVKHGVMFLDEIGELTPELQIKLLRVVQERQFTPVGSHETRRFQGRLVAATHQDLDRLRQEGRFRDDFYYRIATDVIRIPGLQERIADRPAELHELAAALLENVLGHRNPEIEARVLQDLDQATPLRYPWPGNVRELEQAVRSILLTHRFTPAKPEARGNSWLDRAERGELNAKEFMGAYCGMLYKRMGTYDAVGAHLGIDRRTVKKYVDAAKEH